MYYCYPLRRSTYPYQCLDPFENHQKYANPTTFPNLGFFDRIDAIDLLLSADVYYQIMVGKRVVVSNSLPAAFESLFSCYIIGPFECSIYLNSSS